MKGKISVQEVVTIFQEIQNQPDKLFEMIHVDVRESVRHHNGSHILACLQGIGKAQIKVLRDRKWEFNTHIIQRFRQRGIACY